MRGSDFLRAVAVLDTHAADEAIARTQIGRLYYAAFWVFCAATFFGGVYAAVVLSFRFAAADCAAPARRPRALSAVMAGGVFAGVIGLLLLLGAFAATWLREGR